MAIRDLSCAIDACPLLFHRRVQTPAISRSTRASASPALARRHPRDDLWPLACCSPGTVAKRACTPFLVWPCISTLISSCRGWSEPSFATCLSATEATSTSDWPRPDASGGTSRLEANGDAPFIFLDGRSSTGATKRYP